MFCKNRLSFAFLAKFSLPPHDFIDRTKIYILPNTADKANRTPTLP